MCVIFASLYPDKEAKNIASAFLIFSLVLPNIARYHGNPLPL
jgi:hypothetical protein